MRKITDPKKVIRGLEIAYIDVAKVSPIGFKRVLSIRFFDKK